MRRESAFVVAHYKDDNDRRVLYLNEEGHSTWWLVNAKMYSSLELAKEAKYYKELECKQMMGDNHPMLGKYFIEQVVMERIPDNKEE